MKRSDFNTIIELPIEFDVRGFHYNQVYHNNGWYIYQVTRTYDNGYSKEFFEFFKEKVVKAVEYNNGWNQVEGIGKIVYPCDEDFGKFAWTLPTFDGCLRKMTEKSKI